MNEFHCRLRKHENIQINYRGVKSSKVWLRIILATALKVAQSNLLVFISVVYQWDWIKKI